MSRPIYANAILPILSGSQTSTNLDFCSGRMLRPKGFGLGLGTYGLALTLRIEALALRFWHWLHHS